METYDTVVTSSKHLKPLINKITPFFVSLSKIYTYVGYKTVNSAVIWTTKWTLGTMDQTINFEPLFNAHIWLVRGLYRQIWN